MLQTAEKVEEKNWVICLVSIFPLWVLELSKVFFCNFVPIPARNLSLLKQFAYMHQKGLVMHFQRMVTPFFSSTFSALTACNIHFCN